MIANLKKEDLTFETSEFEIYEKRDPIEMDPSHSVLDTFKESIRSVSQKEPQYFGSLSAGDLYHTMKNGIPGAWIGPGDPKASPSGKRADSGRGHHRGGKDLCPVDFEVLHRYLLISCDAATGLQTSDTGLFYRGIDP